MNNHESSIPHKHRGFTSMFGAGQLTLGLMLPMSRLQNGIPDMSNQLSLARQADQLGFSALWLRDVPLFDREFNDAGQVYDPWVWLGQLATVTEHIALSTAGIVLPLRHPLHTAKAAATVDALSGGRFLLGAASGDRASEYTAFGVPYESRGALYREHVDVIRRAMSEAYPDLSGTFGELHGLDVLPKPPAGRLPLLAIGSAQQTVQWIAKEMDGWVTYFRPLQDQLPRIQLWRGADHGQGKERLRPFAQSFFIDLTDDPDTAPSPIFLGYRLGRNQLLKELEALKAGGANHVMFNLRYSTRPATEVVEELSEFILPAYPRLGGGTTQS